MIKEKLAEIATVLGISKEESTRDLRRFIHEMVAEENDKCKAYIQSRKKAKAQR